MREEYYIVDVRAEWKRRPYITLWRPNNANYAYPLPWAGRYSKPTVDEGGEYYAKRRYGSPRAWDRFPVPCDVVERLAEAWPAPGIIDGNTGPVLLNNAATRRALLRAKYVPATADTGGSHA